MAGGAETPNIAALPAIARLGACESARGPDADLANGAIDPKVQPVGNDADEPGGMVGQGGQE